MQAACAPSEVGRGPGSCSCHGEKGDVMGTAQAWPASGDPRHSCSVLRTPACRAGRMTKKHTQKCNVRTARSHFINHSVNLSSRALFRMCLRGEGALGVR